MYVQQGSDSAVEEVAGGEDLSSRPPCCVQGDVPPGSSPIYIDDFFILIRVARGAMGRRTPAYAARSSLCLCGITAAMASMRASSVRRASTPDTRSLARHR